MTRLQILHLALVSALLALAVMTPAVHGAAIVVPGADAVGLAKYSSGGSGKGDYRKQDLAKDDDVTRVSRPRRAVGRDETEPKEAFAQDENVVRVDNLNAAPRVGHFKTGTDGGNSLVGRIKAGIIKAGSIMAGQ
ncbi:hypothetical protein AMAG_15919 [Allomyces macrogynus ATCC 38327]|uniref:Uncharacterized protein n=1 Tax=Allomyces macrogynus (strain ATCC 38327) TaxID=578462 RepID=A0A0L0TB64_ALLM3|nr:hypothetical protein AMAG_15919 [Allomyces macrogynus ATCC 38327]|eukprot:KNE71977.1 hypothetical protein AMAG_15919 [Allomyces macrogynus ATCC 38327]